MDLDQAVDQAQGLCSDIFILIEGLNPFKDASEGASIDIQGALPKSEEA